MEKKYEALGIVFITDPANNVVLEDDGYQAVSYLKKIGCKDPFRAIKKGEWKGYTIIDNL